MIILTEMIMSRNNYFSGNLAEKLIMMLTFVLQSMQCVIRNSEKYNQGWRM